MDTRTGELVSGDDVKQMNERLQAFFRPVTQKDLTLRQRDRRRISLQDHTSRVGKQLMAARGAMRNQPCPCGSGKKTKQCCYQRAKTNSQ